MLAESYATRTRMHTQMVFNSMCATRRERERYSEAWNSHNEMCTVNAHHRHHHSCEYNYHRIGRAHWASTVAYERYEAAVDDGICVRFLGRFRSAHVCGRYARFVCVWMCDRKNRKNRKHRGSNVHCVGEFRTIVCLRYLCMPR